MNEKDIKKIEKIMHDYGYYWCINKGTWERFKRLYARKKPKNKISEVGK